MSEYITFDTNKNSGGYTGYASGAGLADLLKTMIKPVMIEIGSDVGDTSDYLLSNVPTLKLHAVDPYQNYIDWNDNKLYERADVYTNYVKRMEKFGSRWVLHRKYSDDAVTDFEDESVDLVFVDGLHTYEQVLKDCENYYSKCKTGGIFAGHDFGAIEGVRQAVLEFAAKVGKEISFTNHDVWYWVK